MRPTTSRRLALATVTALGLGTASLVSATPAHAADWTTAVSIHKARTQLCKESVRGGWRIRIRLDNRDSAHGHTAGMSRNDTLVSVRAVAGEISRVKSLVVQRGDELIVGMGEFTGEGLGGPQDLARVRAC